VYHKLYGGGILAAHADLVMQAAVLAQGLVDGHCFVDGNKRTAWVSLRAFLLVTRGWRVVTTTAEATERMLRLTTKEESATELADWLRHHLR
jgi:death-on-curing protein